MKAFIKDLRSSVLAILFFAVLLCGLYPLIVYGVSSLVFPKQAGGSLIKNQGKVVGSELIGQGFSSPRYFHSRPSAAGKGYDASASSGSNLGPTSQKLMDSIKANIETYRRVNGLALDVKIPADAVTASGSGLDPHISPANASLQVARVARERGLDPAIVSAEVSRATDAPFLGILGEPGVNVLQLNLALDAKNAR